MIINTLTFTKQMLAAMPGPERRLLLLLGHACNEINVFAKLIMVVRKDSAPTPLIERAELGQVQTFMRVLVGKLHEAWELFKGRVHGDRVLALKYLPRLSAEGQQALDKLNKHFRHGSPLTRIRNNFSFHYRDDKDVVEASFLNAPENEPWEFYIGTAIGHSYFFASEVVVSWGAVSLAKDPASPAASDDAQRYMEAFARLGSIMIEVSGNVICLFTELIDAILHEALPEARAESAWHPDGPKLSTFSLPFFFEGQDALEWGGRPGEGAI